MNLVALVELLNKENAYMEKLISRLNENTPIIGHSIAPINGGLINSESGYDTFEEIVAYLKKSAVFIRKYCIIYE